MRQDRAAFFKVVLDPAVAFIDLARFYSDYLGPLFGDQHAHFVRRVQECLLPRGIDLAPAQILARDGALNRDFVRAHCPRIEPTLYTEAGLDVFEAHELLPAGPNEWFDRSMPIALNHRCSNPNRPAFIAYRGYGRSLFVSPFGFQYFDRAAGYYWPAASLRAYSSAIAFCPVRVMPGPVVLVQDGGDGSNFAHFTFDYVTRIGHIVRSGLVDPAACTFVMGGARLPYHDLVLKTLCELHGLQPDQFYFPAGREVLQLEGAFLFFSDQKLAPMHPAQVAHPRSMQILRDVTTRVPATVPGTARRLFISRGDAELRMIGNEPELVERALARGFEVIRLAELPIEQQIAQMRGADIVVGAHGMGFTLSLFREGPLTLLELFHPTLGTDAYALMSRARKLDYHFLLGTSLEDDKAGYWIDPEQFDRALDRLLGPRPAPDAASPKPRAGAGAQIQEAKATMIVPPLSPLHQTIMTLISSGHLRLHFSQFGEDAVLWSYLQAKRDGFYVDVGCHHPLRYSNTALFHLFNGWRGINIDVDERAIAAFNTHRPGDTNVCAAIGLEEGELDITIFDDGALNTLDQGMANNPRWSAMGRTTRRVTVQPLRRLLEQHMPPGQPIDLLNVDIEGLDLAALQSNDWERFRPHFIAIEVHGFNVAKPADNTVFQFLTSHLYHLVSHAFATSIYIDTQPRP